MMRRFGLLLALIVSFVSVFGCQSKIIAPEWKYKKEGIRVHVRADHKLNLYNSKAHTLYICFYQLTELNFFDQLSQDGHGIQKLLEGKLADASIASVDTKVIHAGENITIILDRAERAQYFAIVTGYFSLLDDGRMVRRHKLQVYKEKGEFMSRKYYCIPCDIDIELALGANQIEYSKVIAKNEKCRNECE